MFKTLTRTLKLGLTAITILTAGGFAGTAFAQTYADDRVGYCANNPTNYRCPRQVDNCVRYPFGTNTYYYGSGGCARTFTAQELIVAKTRYCGKAGNVRKSVCRETLNRVSAATWTKDRLDNRRTISTRINTANRRNEFLQGGAAGLDDSGAHIAYRPTQIGALNFKTARFGRGSGVALGGDVTSGVAFFRGGRRGDSDHYYRYYAGILSGTDLGAPVTQTSGTASWVGQLKSVWFESNRDFVLEVTFGNTPGKAGSIRAFVGKDQTQDFWSHFYLKGKFDNAGLITGTIVAGKYTNNDRNDTTGYRRHGTLTGLIGEEGAVGAFIDNDNNFYSGGFVARPAEDVTGAVAFLNGECADDPLHELCFLSNERAVKIIKDCNGTWTPTSQTSKPHCTEVVNSCVNDPFGETCHDVLGGHTLNIAQVRFCGGNDNHNDKRCDPIFERATGANWAKKNPTITTSIDIEKANQILKGWLTGLNDYDLNVQHHGSLLLDSGTFNGKTLSENGASSATNGTAGFIRGYTVHAGILSATDLGAPVTGNSGTTASWVGHIQSGGLQTNQDFVLEVTFGNAESGKAGSVEAFVPYTNSDLDRYGSGHLRLQGDFDDTGVIDGKVTAKKYNNSDRNNLDSHIIDRVNARTDGGDGDIVGLIGEKGAVGAFVSTHGYYVGGFVARPAEDVEGAVAFLNKTCGDATSNLSDPGDPFHEFCYLRKTEQTARIANCTVDSHADTSPCQRAVQQNSCITNPFKSGCRYNVNFRDIYPAATANRIQYCNNTGSAINDPLCQYTEVIAGICAYSPFAPVCLKGNHNNAGRTPEKFTACRATGPTVPTCHGVRKQTSMLTPNADTWVNDFVRKDNPNGLSLVADPNKRSQFMEGGNLRLDQAGITVKKLGELYFSDIPHLNLAGPADDLPSDEDSTASPNGVAFFRARSSSISEILASGILSGTDLGAPATGASGTTAVWQGVFQSLWIATRTEFELEVTFDGSTGSSNTGSIKAFIDRTGDRYASFLPHYYLEGQFDANGLIKGKVTAARFVDVDADPDNTNGRAYKGVLRGLIGKDSAVGSFVGGEIADSTVNGNTFTNSGYFSGGFVAHSFTVNYDAWVDAANPLAVATTSSTTNRFLTTTATALNKGRVSGSSIAVTMNSAQYNGVALDGDVTDGFAYLRGSVNHVGILANTSLGAPLNKITAEGTWKGSFVSAEGSNSITKKSFILDVDFANENVSATIATTPYAFTGTFNTRGVIDGTITHTGPNKVSNGIMTGLIGSEGAVGVFISNADADVSYGGGFVARPTR